MTGIFYSWDCSIFQYQTMCKSSVELGLVYKTFVNKHLRNSVAAPKKQNASTVHVTLGFSGSWTRLSFPYNQKHNSLETFFLSESCAVQPNEARWWARSCSRSGRCHIRSSTLVYVMKSHDRKKLSETCTNPEVRFLAHKYCYTSKLFFETLSMLSMRIQLFNVNNSECMKQHCTPPL